MTLMTIIKIALIAWLAMGPVTGIVIVILVNKEIRKSKEIKKSDGPDDE